MGRRSVSNLFEQLADLNALAENLADITAKSVSLPMLPATQTSQINQYLEVSASWLDLASTSLPLLTAIAYLPSAKHKPNSQHWRKHIALYILIGTRKHVNRHTLQQGIAALLSEYHLKQTPKPANVRRKIVAQLSKLGQHYWAFRLSLTNLSWLDSDDVFASAWRWSALLKQNPERCIADTMQWLALNSLPDQQLILTSMLHYPGVLHEGCRVQYKQHIAVIVGQLPEQLLLFTPHNEAFTWVTRNELVADSGSRVSLVQWIQLVERLNTLQSTESNGKQEPLFIMPDYTWAQPVSYPVAKPPTTLVKLLRALHDPDVAVKKIVELVNAESSFTTFLTQAASADNRMRLPVTDLKHSILTYGLERVGQMLIQHALYQRLTQHYFPLLPWFCKLAQVAAHIAGELAISTKRITPQSAGLVTTIAISPLFTFPGAKVMTRLPSSPTHLYQVASLLSTKPATLQTVIRQHQLSLSAAWQQHALQSKLIAYYGKLPSTVPASLRLAHCITGLSIIWARHWLLGQTPCAQTREFIAQTKIAHPELTQQEATIKLSVMPHLVSPLNAFYSNVHSADQ